jgi:hypothetical protein
LTKRIERRTRWVERPTGDRRICTNTMQQQHGMERACRRKVPWASARVAELAAEQRTIENGRRFYAYRCRYCKLWHLSSRDQTLARTIALLEQHLGLRPPR